MTEESHTKTYRTGRKDKHELTARPGLAADHSLHHRHVAVCHIEPAMKNIHFMKNFQANKRANIRANTA